MTTSPTGPTRSRGAARRGARPGTFVGISSKTLRLVGGCLVAGTAAAVAVPLVQGAVLWATERPEVPGPHGLDGVHPAPGGGHTPLDLVWLGDSLASGVGADTADQAFPVRAASLYGASLGRPVALTCLALPGANTADVVAHQLPVAVERLTAGSVAVLTVGSNDVAGLTSPRQFRAGYGAMLQALVATGAIVVAVGLPDIGAVTAMGQPLRGLAGWVGRRASRQVSAMATAHGAHYLAIDTRPPRGTPWAVFLAADRWHPNADTYAMWADGFVGLMERVSLSR
ncbi:MAG: SGNH/GDSL hydrolase family protein [Acidimicrobiales bacterium]